MLLLPTLWFRLSLSSSDRNSSSELAESSAGGGARCACFGGTEEEEEEGGSEEEEEEGGRSKGGGGKGGEEGGGAEAEVERARAPPSCPAEPGLRGVWRDFQVLLITSPSSSSLSLRNTGDSHWEGGRLTAGRGTCRDLGVFGLPAGMCTDSMLITALESTGLVAGTYLTLMNGNFKLDYRVKKTEIVTTVQMHTNCTVRYTTQKNNIKVKVAS